MGQPPASQPPASQHPASQLPSNSSPFIPVTLEEQYRMVRSAGSDFEAYVVFGGHQLGVFYNWCALFVICIIVSSLSFTGLRPKLQWEIIPSRAGKLLKLSKMLALLGMTGYIMVSSLSPSPSVFVRDHFLVPPMMTSLLQETTDLLRHTS